MMLHRTPTPQPQIDRPAAVMATVWVMLDPVDRSALTWCLDRLEPRLRHAREARSDAPHVITIDAGVCDRCPRRNQSP